jgi:hypothetical protein
VKIHRKMDNSRKTKNAPSSKGIFWKGIFGKMIFEWGGSGE